MGMKMNAKGRALDGGPLTVCMNDCAIDRGQSSTELAPLCFGLGCAFAEQRWRGYIERNGEIAALVCLEIKHMYSAPAPR